MLLNCKPVRRNKDRTKDGWVLGQLNIFQKPNKKLEVFAKEAALSTGEL